MITIAEMMQIHEENGEKFPAGVGEVKSEWVPMSPENEARVAELSAIEAAKTELRKVAMQLHNEARAVLQNVFLCPADVADAIDHLGVAYHAIEDSLRSPIITAALNLPNK